ncbi:MAG: hypothetical protein ACD_79C01302G0004 [uncultured bacterium]|nr:MAG: hypothetical protein ACD_79C01302G0004 [uncultured bacterium]
MISWWRTKLGDEEIYSVRDSINQECISQGEKTLLFEREIAKALNVRYAVAVPSGSIALLMSLMVLGIKKNDEVIVPNRTFIATAHAALLLGAKIILIDVVPNIPVLNVSELKKKITSKTKAIIPVHLNGRSVDMLELNKIAKEYNLKVIEDAAQAIFSKNEYGFLGTQSDVGCFSLGVTKLLTTGQGGIAVTNDEELYASMKKCRNHGVNDTLSDLYTQFGFNFKFNDILASVGIAQLAKIKGTIDYVKKVYNLYKEELKGIECMQIIPVNIEKGEIPLWVEVLCTKREELMKFLLGNGIETRRFLPDLHFSRHLKARKAVFLNSEKFHKYGVFLPCGPNQSTKDIEFVISKIKEFNKQN